MDDLDMLDNFSSLIPSKRYKSWKGNILINVSFYSIHFLCNTYMLTFFFNFMNLMKMQ